jgi:hypothetical protein
VYAAVAASATDGCNMGYRGAMGMRRRLLTGG